MLAKLSLAANANTISVVPGRANENLRVVSCYKHVGSTLLPDGTINAEIFHRVGASNGSFGKYANSSRVDSDVYFSTRIILLESLH